MSSNSCPWPCAPLHAILWDFTRCISTSGWFKAVLLSPVSAYRNLDATYLFVKWWALKLVFLLLPGELQTGLSPPSWLKVTSRKACRPSRHCRRWSMLSRRFPWRLRCFSLYSMPLRYSKPNEELKNLTYQCNGDMWHDCFTFYFSERTKRKLFRLTSEVIYLIVGQV